MAAEANLAKVTALRALLVENNIDAYIIPTNDAHISEYVSQRDARRSFISEFTGSAGTAVVTKDECLLWTDGRYFLQAEKQLTPHWTLMKDGQPGTLNIQDYLTSKLPAGAVVGIDPSLLPVIKYQEFEKAFASQKLTLKSFLTNFVDQVWGAEQPALSNGVIKAHPIEYAGETTASKVEKIRAKMTASKAYALVLCALDEIAYVFNLRGSDISFNPVFLSYAVITQDDVTLFVDEKKFDADVKLSEDIKIKPYDAIIPYLQSLKDVLVANQKADKFSKVWVDEAKSNYSLFYAFNCNTLDEVDEFIITKANPVTLMKAIKNQAELEGMKQAHIRDGAAVSRFLAFFESQYNTLPTTDGEASPWDEYKVACKLENFRQEQEKFVQLSFDTISSVGPNGAIIHYKPDETKSSPVASGNIYLLDSGAQYLDGTTDITRTFWIPSPTKPEPTAFQKDVYTRVLQGHIQLATVKFPTNTVGPAIDALARQYLWAIHTNFLHGTGHGVGSYLNVHEGPCGIAMPTRPGPQLTTPLVDGMVLSNEPGYYHDGEFGIRIENLVYVYEVEDSKLEKFNTKYGKWYGFDNLTYVPIDRTLINKDLLSQDHIDYLNAYHKKCYDLLLPLLQQQKDDVAIAWLEKNTAPL